MKQQHPGRYELSDRVLLIGIGLAVLYWLLDAVVSAIVSRHASLLASLIPADPSQMAVRLFGAVILVMFGIFAQGIINQRKWAEARERQHKTDLEILSNIAMRFVELPLEEDLYQFIATQLKSLIEDAVVIVSVFDDAEQDFRVCAALGHEAYGTLLPSLLGDDLLNMTFTLTKGARANITSGKLVKVPGGIHGLCFTQLPGEVCAEIERTCNIGDVYIIGFAKKDGIFGDAVILTRKGTTLERRNIIETFANQASVALLRRQAEENLRALSLIDELTGLYNRRGFFTLAAQQLKIAGRMKRGLMLLFADVDSMKWINDTLGHQQGDLAISEAAAVLRETFRKSDIIARIGGDEFVALVIDADEENERVITSRLQDSIAQRNSLPARAYTLALSIGTALYNPENICSIHEMLVRADSAMYEHKRRKNDIASRQG